MKTNFTHQAWEEYLYWIENDKKVIKKINNLIKEIKRDPYEGIGKPEPLKYEFAGMWSRHINDEHRLVYQVFEDEILISKCRFHYRK